MRLRIPVAVLTAAVFAASLLTPSVLTAQEPALLRDLAFVRGLAKELHFSGLAQKETERLRAVHKDADAQRALQLIDIEVAMIGAQTTSDRERQRTLYRGAIAKAKDTVESASGELAQQALNILTEATFLFGQFLTDELDLAREDDPAQVPALEEEAAQIFRAGIDACDQAMAALADQRAGDPQKRIEYGVTWMRKGILQRQQARAVRKDRGFLINRAKHTLEEVIFEYGEETALGMRAMFEWAQCDEVVGSLGEAALSYSDTIDTIKKAYEDRDVLGLGPDMIQFLGDMAQEVYHRLARTHFENGDTDKVLEAADAMRALLAELGEAGADPFDIAHPRFGHSVFLTEARAKAETGQADQIEQAMAMAKRINEAHANDFVGIQAKAVIKSILDTQKSMVSGTLLFEIAKGEFQNRNYEAARNGLKRALAAMTDTEANATGMEVWSMMAFSLALEQRFLESTLAYVEGLEQFGATGGPQVEEAASKLRSALARLKQQSRKDPAFAQIEQRANQLIGQYGGTGSADEINWQAAAAAMSDKNYNKAVQSYEKITPEYLRYEIARVRRAYALSMTGDYDGSRRAFSEYRAWLETKDALIPEDRSDKKQIRDSALAEMAFREAYMAYKVATGSAENGAVKDLSKYPGVISALEGFLSSHGAHGENYVPYAYDALVRLYVESGALDKAEEGYRKLKTVKGGASLLPMVSTVVFAAWLTEVDNRNKDLDGAIATGKDGKALSALRDKLSEAHIKVVQLGLEYARESANPQYGVLYNALQSCRTLGNWETVTEIARKLIEDFGERAEYRQRIDSIVRPMVGEAALHKENYQVAYDMLIEAEKASPSNYEVKRLLCLALGGWVERDPRLGTMVQKPGLGRYDEAYVKYFTEYRNYALRSGIEKYSLGWYEFQWNSYYYAKKAAEKDSKYQGFANTLFRSARSTDDFASLLKYGARGKELQDFFQQLR